MSSVQANNFRTARQVFDAWFDGRTGDREAWWVRLVAALWTESGCRVLAHTGEWKGGGRINSRQRAVLAQSAQLYRERFGREPDGFGSNGGSVGALQQIPTEVAWIATKDGLDDGAPTPWGGWGTITDCMALETSIPKFLAQLRVTDDPVYKGKLTASPVVADLLRVQQPLASEVAANYGQGVVEVASAIAATFPRIETKDWWTELATNFDEAKQELSDMIDKKFQVLGQQVASLYNDNVLTNDDGTPSGLPYGKQAAGFNDLRALAASLGPQKSQVDGQTYPIGDYLVSIDRKLSTLIDTVTALAAKQNK